MNENQLREMVDAFLAWPLPDDVCADAVACRAGASYRTGTNLLTAAQARAMFEHCLAVVRAHDRDGERWRERAEQLARMSDGETAERYWAKVDALVERNRGSIPERAAADAAMRAEG